MVELKGGKHLALLLVLLGDEAIMSDALNDVFIVAFEAFGEAFGDDLDDEEE